MTDEPRRHPLFLLLLGLLALLTIPFPFIGGELLFVFGLPLWFWWSFTMTAALSFTTAWGILRLWRDDGQE